MTLTETVLKDLVGEPDAPEITAATIMAVTAEYFAISDRRPRSARSRSRVLVSARQMAMYLCRELTDLSLPKIGEKFGGRDHTTVMHAERKIRAQMAEKLTVYNQITELTSRIKVAGPRPRMRRAEVSCAARRTAHSGVGSCGQPVDVVWTTRDVHRPSTARRRHWAMSDRLSSTAESPANASGVRAVVPSYPQLR